MANEFKIKNALQILNSQPVKGISDSSIFTDDTSTLATKNAIKGYTESNFVSESGGTFTGEVTFDGSIHVDHITSNTDPSGLTISPVKYLQFNTEYVNPEHNEGKVHWNDDDKTLNLDNILNLFL